MAEKNNADRPAAPVADSRRKRLAEALRANLKRRKNHGAAETAKEQDRTPEEEQRD